VTSSNWGRVVIFKKSLKCSTYTGVCNEFRVGAKHDLPRSESGQ
jgi:hypothetical protein